MGQYVRWQALIALIGVIFLATYLNSIAIVQQVEVVPANRGVFREGVVGKPQLLNPLLAFYNPVDQDVASLIFEGLTREDGRGNLIPVLAQDWSVSRDGRIYVFSLRQDVLWADGEAFTADDVLFTLNLIQSEDFPGDPALQRLWQSVEIEKIDEYTIRFVLSEPLPSFLYHTTVGILPRHSLGQIEAGDLLAHPFNLSPLGTGPFQIKEATDRYILLETNPNYHARTGKIREVRLHFYSDSNAARHALERQEIDGMALTTFTTLQQLQPQTGLKFFSTSLPRYNVAHFNLQAPEALPFFQDRMVRQALWKLIDRQELIDTVLNGQAILANGPILPWSWAYNPNQKYPDYAPEEAAALLAEAGWQDFDGDGIREKEGARFQFLLLTNNDPVQHAVASYLAEQWVKAGIAVSLETVADDLFERVSQRQFDMALVDTQLSGDPDPYGLWHQSQIEGGQNVSGWDSINASHMLEQGRLTVDRNERIKFYYTFQQIFADEMPALILYHPTYSYVVRDNIKGVQLGAMVFPSGRFKTIADWYTLTEQVIETIADQRLDSLNE